LFGLECPSHSESNWWLIQSLVWLNGLLIKKIFYRSDLISDPDQKKSSFSTVDGNLSD
jgi:hypothetical protein